MPAATPARAESDPKWSELVPDGLPRLSRRSALLGAAALLAPLAPRLVAAETAAAQPKGAPAELPVRLDANENPYGPSPAARRAIVACVGEAPRYADDVIQELITALAAHLHLDRSQITIGSGSGELLNMAPLLAAEGGPGGELIAALPTFEQLPEFGAKFGVETRWVPLDADHRHDLAAMRAAVTPRTRLIYVCNPNNPTGTAVRSDAIEEFVKSVPDSVLVLVDEAYIDLVDAPGVGTVVPLINQHRNLLVTRTFSKIHGLAGLRVGYGLAAPELTARLRNKQLAFPNIAGLRAALASLEDQQFLTATRRALLADRNRIQTTLDRLGRPHTKSQGNFVFFDAGMPVPMFRKAMLDRGVRVGRPFARYDTWSRVSIGTRAEVDRFLKELPAALRRSA